MASKNPYYKPVPRKVAGLQKSHELYMKGIVKEIKNPRKDRSPVEIEFEKSK